MRFRVWMLAGSRDVERVRREVKMEIMGEEVPKRCEGLRRFEGREGMGVARGMVVVGGVVGGMRGKRGWQSQTVP